MAELNRTMRPKELVEWIAHDELSAQERREAIDRIKRERGR